MPNSKKIAWVEVARRGAAQPVLWMDSFMEVFSRGYLSTAHKTRWHLKNYRQFDSARWFGQSDLEEYQAVMEKAANSSGNVLQSYANEYQKRIEAYRRFGEKRANGDFAKYSNQKLLQIFNQWFEHTKKVFSFAYDYIFINKFLPDIITSIVSSRVKDIQKQNHHLGILFAADSTSEARLEKISLVNLAYLIRRRKWTLSHKEIGVRLDYHQKKFAHLGFYYFRGAAYTAGDLRKRLREYLKLPLADLKKMRLDFREQENNAALTKLVTKELRLDQQTIRYIKHVKRWASLATQVDETYNFVVYKLWPFWHEVARRLGVTYQEFYSLLAKEIQSGLLLGKLPTALKREARLRLQDHAIILENGKKRVLAGKPLVVYARREKQAQDQIVNIDVLKGQAASPGVVSGRVRLIFSTHDVGKVERGNILVASATNPTYVPAMERAAAIVTDEGGLLSHAAIVSRELKIPCIVGTKIATRVFKDGDRVEVDAERGIVRKLDKQ